MSNFKILGSGVFFDCYKFRMLLFENNIDLWFVYGIIWEFFGFFVYIYIVVDMDGIEKFWVVDYVGFKVFYIQQRWFRDMKVRWQMNFEGLEQYIVKFMVCLDLNGISLVRWEYYFLRYFVFKYEYGEWL